MMKEINSQMEKEKLITLEMNKKEPHSETEGNQKEEKILKEARRKLPITFKKIQVRIKAFQRLKQKAEHKGMIYSKCRK